ncbi:MAG: hypothetical protein R3D00_05755 [Bacteroidia bacterium]
MDFSSTESWFDITVAVVSVAAVIIGLVTIRKMLKEESLSLKQPLVQPEITLPESPGYSRTKSVIETIEEKNKKENPPETTASRLKKSETAPSPVKASPKIIAIPEPRNREKQGISDIFFNRFRRKISTQTGKSLIITTDEVLTKPPKHHVPPRLKGDQLTLESPNKLLFRLKNEGHKLIYKKIQAGPNNELNITYEPPQRRINMLLEEYDQGEIISFSLTGTNVISQTYHFTIHYGDMNGNYYTQQIGGLGREFPIVDAPVKV